MLDTVDHLNYPRKGASEIAVHAAGHNTVAYFALDYEAVRYAKWLRSLGYAPAMYTIAEFDECAAAGVL